MTWFCFLLLFGLIYLMFPCQGVVYPPSGESEFTFLPGSTEKIKWTFDDNITALTARNWIFASTGSSTVRGLASIFGTGSAIIDSSNPVDIAIEKPATLILKNVDRRYNGKYTFRVSGSFTSDSTVDVFIAEKPSVTLNCPSSVHLNEGDNFTCLCRGQNGNPPANVTWFKDEVKFSGVGTEKQTLNLLNVSEAENGIYNCVSTSYPHENYTDEKSIRIIVINNYSPTNTSISFSENPAVFSQSLNVTCYSDGLPEPSYTIFHNDTKVNNTGNLYVIYNVMWKDAGTYKCFANIPLGNDSHSGFLKVIEKAEPTTQPIKSQYQPSMATNPAVITTCIPIYTTTCNCPTTTSTPPAGDGLGKSGSGTEWYIIVVSLASGIIFGILFSYIVSFSRRKLRGSQPQHSLYPKPRPPTTQIDSNYQELDLTKMNKEDNYQSLRGNAARNNGVNDNESNYTELNKTRDLENNYQSLT